MASTMEVVARARTADGQDAVLKVAIPEALGASVDQVNPNPREAYGGAVRNPAPGVGHASTPDGGACSGESADARSAGRATVGRTWPSVLRRVRDRAGARPPTGCGLRPRPDAWSSTATPTAPTSPGLARRYCALLAAETGAEERTIWQWGFLERVSTGLFALACGANDVARPFLDTAELLA